MTSELSHGFECVVRDRPSGPEGGRYSHSLPSQVMDEKRGHVVNRRGPFGLATGVLMLRGLCLTLFPLHHLVLGCDQFQAAALLTLGILPGIFLESTFDLNVIAFGDIVGERHAFVTEHGDRNARGFGDALLVGIVVLVLDVDRARASGWHRRTRS